MSSIKTCNNRCIFCFVDQLPSGLRSSLYIKDDDFLMSFMYGNFITLSNLRELHIQKIIKSRLEPLYVSLHSLDMQVRKQIFGTGRHLKGLKNFKELAQSQISMHVQIVVCPHINDGDRLIETLDELVLSYPSVKSIGLVPVGLTKYNRHTSLKPFTAKQAQETLDTVTGFTKLKKVENKVFLSDEFYIIAGKSFPSYQYYSKFFQINNGIGKSRDFMESFKRLAPSSLKTRALIVSSEYGSYVFNQLYQEIEMKGRLPLLTVKNNFLGTSIKATGLLCGADIINQLKKINFDRYSVVILPDCIFNEQGLTLDGYKKENILSINDKLRIIKENAKELIGELY